MAARGEQFDVFLVTADTVYKGVPYHVVCGWAEQGRVNADDKLRPAGSTAPWMRVGDHPMVSDFLPRKAKIYSAPLPIAKSVNSDYPTEPAHAIEMDRWKKSPEDDDDDVGDGNGGAEGNLHQGPRHARLPHEQRHLPLRPRRTLPQNSTLLAGT